MKKSGVCVWTLIVLLTVFMLTACQTEGREQILQLSFAEVKEGVLSPLPVYLVRLPGGETWDAIIPFWSQTSATLEVFGFDPERDLPEIIVDAGKNCQYVDSQFFWQSEDTLVATVIMRCDPPQPLFFQEWFKGGW